ncbi:MAG: ABC transporter ATP-binding protein [Candidatus Omnitrophica bacterium]|nr:ABC transporter ATP-binding protein [Candidatus Omnitrophota bacterium]
MDLTVSGGGKRLGIVGDNGSGKTTLLRIIAGVTRPTHGTVMVNGRVVPLLELGAGMHPDLTGRENVYLNGILLGMRRSEVSRKFGRIVEFAGVTEFLDMPLKHYSLGMIMRLGFSVAIHVDADILLIDEAWGVGDVGFQAKTMEQMRQMRNHGASSILVSHDVSILRQLTDEILWLKSGRIAAFGPTESVVKAYWAVAPQRVQ